MRKLKFTGNLYIYKVIIGQQFVAFYVTTFPNNTKLESLLKVAEFLCDSIIIVVVVYSLKKNTEKCNYTNYGLLRVSVSSL